MKEYMSANGDMNATIVEYVNGMEVIRMFNQTASSMGRFKGAVLKVRDITTAWYKHCYPFMSISQVVMPSTIAFVLPVGVVEAAKKARCHDFISLLPEGYNTMIGEGGSTLSGGEKQRISIARAMLKNAPIVLLDEATASVDPENEVYLQQAISTLVKDKTLIVIAHRLSTIRDAEQILVIDNGKLVQHGKHDELVLQEGIYQKYWNIRQNAKAWKVAQ